MSVVRSLRKLSIRDLLVKISAQDLLDYENHNRATARAIWQAQSAEQVARAISKFAPRRNGSDLTRTKSAHVGFLQNIAHTANNEHWKYQKLYFAQFSATFLSRSKKYCTCYEKWVGGIRSVARATRNHHLHPKSKTGWWLGHPSY